MKSPPAPALSPTVEPRGAFRDGREPAGDPPQAEGRSVMRVEFRTASVPAPRILSSIAWKGAGSEGGLWLREQDLTWQPGSLPPPLRKQK